MRGQRNHMLPMGEQESAGAHEERSSAAFGKCSERSFNVSIGIRVAHYQFKPDSVRALQSHYPS